MEVSPVHADDGKTENTHPSPTKVKSGFLTTKRHNDSQIEAMAKECPERIASR